MKPLINKYLNKKEVQIKQENPHFTLKNPNFEFFVSDEFTIEEDSGKSAPKPYQQSRSLTMEEKIEQLKAMSKKTSGTILTKPKKESKGMITIDHAEIVEKMKEDSMKRKRLQNKEDDERREKKLLERKTELSKPISAPTNQPISPFPFGVTPFSKDFKDFKPGVTPLMPSGIVKPQSVFPTPTGGQMPFIPNPMFNMNMMNMNFQGQGMKMPFTMPPPPGKIGIPLARSIPTMDFNVQSDLIVKDCNKVTDDMKRQIVEFIARRQDEKPEDRHIYLLIHEDTQKVGEENFLCQITLHLDYTTNRWSKSIKKTKIEKSN
jgi:hypothetical protein